MSSFDVSTNQFMKEALLFLKKQCLIVSDIIQENTVHKSLLYPSFTKTRVIMIAVTLKSVYSDLFLIEYFAL